LEGFVFDEGIFSADTFYRAGIIPEKAFTVFRKRLLEDEFISFTEASARRQQYYPTKRLLPFILRAKTHCVASIRYVDLGINQINSRVDRVVDDVQDLKAQMHEVHELLAELRRLQAPPPSEDAQKKSAIIAERLDILLAKKLIQ
jgi:hypothetical protein